MKPEKVSNDIFSGLYLEKKFSLLYHKDMTGIFR